MALQNPFKLEKLKIKAYKSVHRLPGDLVSPPFEAMFNPESLSQGYDIKYGKNGRNPVIQPENLTLNLVLDGTGVNAMGIRRLDNHKKVSERVEELLQLTFRMNGDIHEPNYLVMEWGDVIFSCRLRHVEVKYTSFNRDGTALRAELTVALVSDMSDEKRMAEENTSSPDLTHSRIVRSGDTLPLLTKQVYGSSAYYLRVAQINDLDDFRHLTPGQEIYFPPLDTTTAAP